MYFILHELLNFDEEKFESVQFSYTEVRYYRDANFGVYESMADFVLDINNSIEIKEGMKEIKADFLNKNKRYANMWEGCSLNKKTGILMCPLSQLLPSDAYIWKIPDFSRSESKFVRDMREHMIDPDDIKLYYDEKAFPQIYTDFQD